MDNTATTPEVRMGKSFYVQTRLEVTPIPALRNWVTVKYNIYIYIYRITGYVQFVSFNVLKGKITSQVNRDLAESYIKWYDEIKRRNLHRPVMNIPNTPHFIRESMEESITIKKITSHTVYNSRFMSPLSDPHDDDVLSISSNELLEEEKSDLDEGHHVPHGQNMNYIFNNARNKHPSPYNVPSYQDSSMFTNGNRMKNEFYTDYCQLFAISLMMFVFCFAIIGIYSMIDNMQQRIEYLEGVIAHMNQTHI